MDARIIDKIDAKTFFYMEQANAIVSVLSDILPLIYYKTFKNDFELFMKGLWLKTDENYPPILDIKSISSTETLEDLDKIDWDNISEKNKIEWLKKMDLQALLKSLKYRPKSFNMFCEKNSLVKSKMSNVLQSMIEWRNYGVGHKTIYKYEMMTEKVFKLNILEPVWEYYGLLSRYNYSECEPLHKLLLHIEERMNLPFTNIEKICEMTDNTQDELLEVLEKLKIYCDSKGNIYGEKEDDLLYKIEKLEEKDNLVKKLFLEKEIRVERENGETVLIRKVSRKAVLVASLAAFIIVVGIVLGVVAYNNRFYQMDLAKYTHIKIEGKFSGYASANISFDYGSFKKDVVDRVGEKGNKEKLLKKIKMSVDYSKLEVVKEVSNGDIIMPVINVDNDYFESLGIHVNSKMKKTIKGLKPVKRVNPFKDISIEAYGINPFLEVNLVNDKYDIFNKMDIYVVDNIDDWNSSYDSRESGYKLGQNFEAEIDQTKTADLLEKYGIILTKTNETLNLEIDYIKSKDDIKAKAFNRVIDICKKYAQIHDWKKYKHKANKMLFMEAYIYNYQPEGMPTDVDHYLINEVCMVFKVLDKGHFYYRVFTIRDLQNNKGVLDNDYGEIMMDNRIVRQYGFGFEFGHIMHWEDIEFEVDSNNKAYYKSYKELKEDLEEKEKYLVSNKVSVLKRKEIE